MSPSAHPAHPRIGILAARSAARRAFTLIELLTVIAIIGVLAAILIVGMARVRESARASQCLSNQRQIALAFQLYAGENKGYYPRSGTPQSWTLSVKDYIPDRNGIVKHEVFLCPAAPQPPADYLNSAFHYSASFAIENGNSAVAETGVGSPPRRASQGRLHRQPRPHRSARGRCGGPRHLPRQLQPHLQQRPG